jgi:hypothetical protein
LELRWSADKAIEWMARTRGCLVCTNLPVFERKKVGCLNSGLIAGYPNTIYPWKTSPGYLTAPEVAGDQVIEPKVWFLDQFRGDGLPYDPAEIALVRRYTGV